MIRYDITLSDLQQRINAKDENWFHQANLRTQAFQQEGEYNENLRIPDGKGGTRGASPIWSKIKSVYMALQHEKCAYCERQLASEEFGKIEHDLEHYRPKKQAKSWIAPERLASLNNFITPPQNGKADQGYHLLAYHPLNYCTACKTCNSALKRDEFPIEGERQTYTHSPTEMANERALLLYPIGHTDTDPETLITFHGLSPYAIHKEGFAHRRAIANIAFFELSNPLRKALFRERAQRIVAVYAFLTLRGAGNEGEWDEEWHAAIQSYTAAHAPHANCVRSFVKLYEHEPQEATEYFQLAKEYLGSIS